MISEPLNGRENQFINFDFCSWRGWKSLDFIVFIEKPQYQELHQKSPSTAATFL